MTQFEESRDKQEISPKTRDREDVKNTITPNLIDRQEDVRQIVAKWMTIGVLSISFLIIIVGVIDPDRYDKIMEKTSFVFSGLIGVYGTIIGFYFGANK